MPELSPRALDVLRACNALVAESDAPRVLALLATEATALCGGPATFRAVPSGAVSVGSTISAPVHVGGPAGELLGHIDVRAPQVRDGDGEALAILAAQAGVAVAHARMITEARAMHETSARSARHAALALEVGVALTQQDAMHAMLQRVCVSIVSQLDAAFARVWTTSEDGTVLELQASAGLYTHLDGAHARVPVGAFKIGKVAAERKAHLTNDVLHDERVGDPAWAKREGMVSFAGYPLLDGDDVVGVMALFARAPLPKDTLEALAFIADAVSLGVVRKRALEDRARRAWQQRALHDAAIALSSVTTIQALVDVAAEHARSVTGSAGARMALFDDGSGSVGALDVEGAPRAQAPLTSRDGTMLGALEVVGTKDVPFVASDREALRQLAQLTQLAIENIHLIAKLERSNKELDQFAYVASHDLKAPLRGIANLAQWIEEDVGAALSGESRENMSLLRGRVVRLEGLINGILDFSRAGRATKVESVDTGALVRDIVEMLAPPADVEIVVAPDMPALVTDKVSLQQTFMNLVGNALKYGKKPEGRSVVRIESVERNGAWEFAVVDDGPGIAPQFHERIWGIFQRLEARDKVEGTGIGLAVVKKIVESRGGRAWIESNEGAGATFRFLWPARAGLGAE